MYDPAEEEPYLIDADLGKSTDKLAVPSANHRTGTLPFMATDLLVDNPPPHLYRYDLESFFYVLLWMCVQGHCGWDTVGSISAMRKEKSDFFSAERGNPVDHLPILDKFEPLKATWLKKLYRLFWMGRQNLATANMEDVETDMETSGGHITYDQFMKALG
jgi:hypothetical protein